MAAKSFGHVTENFTRVLANLCIGRRVTGVAKKISRFMLLMVVLSSGKTMKDWSRFLPPVLMWYSL